MHQISKTQRSLSVLALSAAFVACNAGETSTTYESEVTNTEATTETTAESGPSADGSTEVRTEAIATLAGGCFWCMETPFEDYPGVSKVTSGYTGGEVVDPSYKAVCSGTTGHAEAVQVHFDPRVIDYSTLLDIFWRQIDPTDAGGQFVDRGSQYRSAIFYHDDEQKRKAEASRDALAASGRFSKPIVTEILPVETYYEAEEYHQDYYEKNPSQYKRYRQGSGRDRYLSSVWGEDLDVEPPVMAKSYTKPSDEVLRERLTELQWRVTQEDATERAFKNEYWDNKRDGIYVDIVTGEPLFSSKDKYKSGTGWPSFTRPLVEANIKCDVDYKLGYARDEVRSKHGDSHLGHVFSDGPEPTGLRFCMNSAALRFIPVEDLAKEGYGEYAKDFE